MVVEVLTHVGVGRATGHGVGDVVLLVDVPVGVVSSVVDVEVVVVVEFLEEGVWLSGGGEPGVVVVDHEVGFLEDVGERSDREWVLWVDEKVGGMRRGSAGSGRSVREGRRGGIRVELHLQSCHRTRQWTVEL